MKIKSDDPAFLPVQQPTCKEDTFKSGLSKREYFAALAFQAIIAKLPLLDSEGKLGKSTSKEENWNLYLDVSYSACRYADALIEELNKETS